VILISSVVVVVMKGLEVYSSYLILLMLMLEAVVVPLYIEVLLQLSN
jgi:hypothetical protein